MEARSITRVETITGLSVARMEPLTGGCVGNVFTVELTDGAELVAKFGDEGSGLKIEGYMLQYLADIGVDLPVPDVLYADDEILLMTRLPGGDKIDLRAERHAAALLAALHDINGPSFGFERDTVIGGLNQKNPVINNWLDFFRDYRLLDMGYRCLASGSLSKSVMFRLERLAGRLEQWIEEPSRPSLIHGDMWSGNVLCRNGRITGFLDPAIYFADAEIELAFMTLFNTFGDDFFARYREFRPIKPGFFENRCDLYNLYPLLVHVRLFGGSYVRSVENTLRRFGC